MKGRPYLWHSSLAFKPPPHPVINTLRLPPAGIDAFEAIALVAVEPLGICNEKAQNKRQSKDQFPSRPRLSLQLPRCPPLCWGGRLCCRLTLLDNCDVFLCRHHLDGIGWVSGDERVCGSSEDRLTFVLGVDDSGHGVVIFGAWHRGGARANLGHARLNWGGQATLKGSSQSEPEIPLLYINAAAFKNTTLGDASNYLLQ